MAADALMAGNAAGELAADVVAMELAGGGKAGGGGGGGGVLATREDCIAEIVRLHELLKAQKGPRRRAGSARQQRADAAAAAAAAAAATGAGPTADDGGVLAPTAGGGTSRDRGRYDVLPLAAQRRRKRTGGTLSERTLRNLRYDITAYLRERYATDELANQVRPPPRPSPSLPTPRPCSHGSLAPLPVPPSPSLPTSPTLFSRFRRPPPFPRRRSHRTWRRSTTSSWMRWCRSGTRRRCGRTW